MSYCSISIRASDPGGDGEGQPRAGAHLRADGAVPTALGFGQVRHVHAAAQRHRLGFTRQPLQRRKGRREWKTLGWSVSIFLVCEFCAKPGVRVLEQPCGL